MRIKLGALLFSTFFNPTPATNSFSSLCVYKFFASPFTDLVLISFPASFSLSLSAARAHIYYWWLIYFYYLKVHMVTQKAESQRALYAPPTRVRERVCVRERNAMIAAHAHFVLYVPGARRVVLFIICKKSEKI